MKIPPAVGSSLVLLIGAVLGAAGMLMFRDSLLGKEGSPEARAAKLEVELRRAAMKIAALETGSGRSSRGDGPGKTSRDRLREIVEDMRAGKPVTPDDLLRVSQPFMRDMSPIVERMRVKGEKAGIDAMSGELARKYHLNESQRKALRDWFTRRAEETAREHAAVWENPNITLEEMVRATKDTRPDKGLDEYMAGVLKGGDLARFQADRLAEKSERVQAEADRKMERIDAIVKLDDVQRDQIFGIMAKQSTDYDPKMDFEWGTGSKPAEGATLMSVLRPEQRAAYEEEKAKQRATAEKELGGMGLSLPENWDLIEEL